MLSLKIQTFNLNNIVIVFKLKLSIFYFLFNSTFYNILLQILFFYIIYLHIFILIDFSEWVFFLFYKNNQILNYNQSTVFFFNNFHNLVEYYYNLNNYKKSFILKNNLDNIFIENSNITLTNFNNFSFNRNYNWDALFNIFLFTTSENTQSLFLQITDKQKLRYFSIRHLNYSNPKNFFKNIKYIFGKNNDSYYFYKNNNNIVKSLLYKSTFEQNQSFFFKKKINSKIRHNFDIIDKYSYFLENIRKLLLVKYRNFNKKIVKNRYSMDINLVKLLLNYSNFGNLSKIKNKNRFNFDFGYLSYRIRGKNLNYFKNNIFKIINNFYHSENSKVRGYDFKFFINFNNKNIIFNKYIYYSDFKFFFFKNNKFNDLSFKNNYRYKKFTNCCDFLFTNFMYTSNVYWFGNSLFYKIPKMYFFNIKNTLNFKYFFKIFNPLRPFFLQNNYNFWKNKKINLIILSKNKHYFFNDTFKNILYFNNSNDTDSEVDKAFRSLYLFGSNFLPWFEYEDSEDKIYDLSYFLNFNENQYNFEQIHNNFFMVECHNDKNLTFKINIYKKYLKINKLLKKNNANFYNKRSKKNIWKIPIRWYFDLNFEKFIRFNYKNTLSCFYEKTLKLKRNVEISEKFSIISPKSYNRFGISNFNNTEFTVYSDHVYTTGVLHNDLFFENRNIPNIVFLPTLENSLNYLKTKNLIYNLPNIKFSVKEISKSSKNYNKFLNLNKFSTYYFKTLNKQLFNNFFLKKKKTINSLVNGGDNLVNFNQDGLNFLQKINKFYIKDRKIIKKNINRFDYSLKLFWNPNNNSDIFINQQDLNFNNKIITDRFLGTFGKKIINRNTNILENINRVDRLKTNDSLIKKIINNNFRLLLLTSNINNLTNDYDSVGILKKPKKIYIKEDREISTKFLYNNTQKPHTFYGYIWDEYLKQSYGFNLNFLNFYNPITKNLKNLNKLKFSSMSSKDNQKRIENSNNMLNNFTGMTKDSEISSTILAKFLTSSGFIKEIHNFENLDEDFYKRKKVMLSDDTKEIKKKYKKSKRKKKLKFKKYFKRELVRSTIYKNKLVKKSINLIKKYEETPVGFKYNNTKNSINFPYFKKLFKIVNESEYIGDVFYKKDNWLLNKNININFSNRSDITKHSKLKKKKKKLIFLFGGKKKRRRFRLNNNLYLNKYFDLSFLSFKNKNKKLILFLDKYSDDSWDNQLKNKIKRNLRKIKSKNKILRYRLRRVKNTSLLSYKKNRNKKLKNFRLNDRFSYNLDIFFGGSLPIKNNPILGQSINLKFINNFENRKNFKFGDYFRFYNKLVLVEHSSDFLFSDKIISFNTNRYKNLYKYKYLSDFNINPMLKKSQPDSLFFENLLLKNIYKTDKVSEIYLENSFSSPEYSNFYGNYLTFYEYSNFSNILLDSSFYYNKNTDNFFNNNGTIISSIVNKNYEYPILNKNISTYSGLSDKQINSFLFLKYNLLKPNNNFENNPIIPKNIYNILNQNIYYKYVEVLYSNFFLFFKNYKIYTYFYKYLNKLNNTNFNLFKVSQKNKVKYTFIDFKGFLNKNIMILPKNKNKIQFSLINWLLRKFNLFNFILFFKIYTFLILFIVLKCKRKCNC